ncbi:MAG: gluconeogenesis factor YvcK family protein [Coriobacteriia bacterium]|nr:gluconeogenesis factor YvcK family protein [Coriobacteriia bacterium]
MSAAPGRAVAIGGGTGLPLALRCLTSSGYDVTAVVTVADDGGSSGTLRRQLGILPPGDIRNCLVALASDDSELARIFQYRFRSGEGLAGHSLGNLIIAALVDIEGGFAEAIRAAGELLGTRGRVLPSTLEDVVLEAVDASGSLVTGQARVAQSTGPVLHVCLVPEAPVAYPPALDAIMSADVVVIGPGSLFTSIMPNLLVDGITEALRDTRASVVYVCNVANQRGETTGMDADEHVGALITHGLAGAIDLVLLHDSDVSPLPGGVPAVDGSAAVRERIEARGIRVVARDLADTTNPIHHDAVRLCHALREVL